MARQRTFERARRQFQWLSVMVRTEVQGLAAVQSLGDISIGVGISPRATLARVRGNARGHMEAAAAADSMIVGLGLIVVEEQAFTAGAASVPSPTDDLNAEWLWHQLFVFGPAVSAQAVNAIDQYSSVEIDSKAMRKMDENEVLGFVWDSVITAGSPTFEGIAAIRTGVLLS